MFSSIRARLGYFQAVEGILDQIGWGEFDDAYCDLWEVIT